MKRTWFQAQIKQGIAISTQCEHERHSTHKRGSNSIFTKGSYPKAYTSRSYQEHSYISHEHHKQGHNLISSISWWAMHMREAHLYYICYKCSLWYKDANTWYDIAYKWEKHIFTAYVTNERSTSLRHMLQHAYVHQPSQPKLKKEKQLQALLANEQM
jgi:hypothetical protein